MTSKVQNHNSLLEFSIPTNPLADEEKEANAKSEVPEPPDGGWGWLAVFCSFMIHAIIHGEMNIFGIFYMEFLRYFGQSKGATSWINSIMLAMSLLVGPLASGLTNQFGCRTVTIIGSILAAFGLVISTIAPNIQFLYFSIGICTGTGFGLMYLPAIVHVTSYFKKKLALAMGIASCGTGIGTFVLAPVTEWMVNTLGWQGAMLITAGFVLQCCVFGALLKPLEPRNLVPLRATTSSFPDQSRKDDLRCSSQLNGIIARNSEACVSTLRVANLKEHSSMLEINNHIQHAHSNHQIRNSTNCDIPSSPTSFIRSRSRPLAERNVLHCGSIGDMFDCGSNAHLHNVQVENNVEKELPRHTAKTKIINCFCPVALQEAFSEMMNFRLMSDVVFLMLGFSSFFINIGYEVPYIYTKDRAVSLGLADEQHASLLLSIIGISSTIGKVTLGFMSDLSCVNTLWLYNACLTTCGLATAFSSFCLNYNLMALYAAAFGATSGVYESLTSVIIVDLSGFDKTANAFGLSLLFGSIGCFIGPPITGWLNDYTGSYDVGFYVSGGMIALSGLMLFFIPCVQHSTKTEIPENEKQTEIQHTSTQSNTPASDSPAKQ